MISILLRPLLPSDLPTLFAQQLDPDANHAKTILLDELIDILCQGPLALKSVSTNNQIRLPPRNPNRRNRPRIELKIIGLHAIAEDHTAFGHVGFQHERGLGGDRPADEARAGRFADERLPDDEQQPVSVPAQPGRGDPDGVGDGTRFVFGPGGLSPKHFRHPIRHIEHAG